MECEDLDEKHEYSDMHVNNSLNLTCTPKPLDVARGAASCQLHVFRSAGGEKYTYVVEVDGSRVPSP